MGSVRKKIGQKGDKKMGTIFGGIQNIFVGKKGEKNLTQNFWGVQLSFVFVKKCWGIGKKIGLKLLFLDPKIQQTGIDQNFRPKKREMVERVKFRPRICFSVQKTI